MDNKLEKAMLLINQDRDSDARKLLNECLIDEPENDTVFGLLAQLELKQENLELALDHIEVAISLDPNFAQYFLTKARINIAQKEYVLALSHLKEVLRLDPFEAYAFSYKALVYNHKKDFTMSLVSADKALAIDPENLLALNLRSTALLKLGREEESYQTIAGALKEDPENSFTHSNYGWGLLEKGEGEKSLNHFREALRLDPNNEYAQSGMAEALKANFFIYRWFLKYQFWMANQVARNQWLFIIGFYVVFRLVSSIADTHPEYSMITTPILIAAGVFAFSTWVMRPISNLILRFHPYGKHLLDDTELKSSAYVGISIAVGLVSGCGYLFTHSPLFLGLFVLGFAMMLPLGSLYNPSKTKGFFKAAVILLLALGIVSLILTGISGSLINGASTLFFFAFIAFQWLANYQNISE